MWPQLLERSLNVDAAHLRVYLGTLDTTLQLLTREAPGAQNHLWVTVALVSTCGDCETLIEYWTAGYWGRS